MNVDDSLKQKALERSARIRIHRKEGISRRPRLRIIASRTFARNGRIVTEYKIDGAREYGRGYDFKMVCGDCAKGSR